MRLSVTFASIKNDQQGGDCTVDFQCRQQRHQIVGSVYLVGNVYLVVVKYSSAHLVRVRHPLAVCLYSLKPRGVGLSVSYRPREL